METILASSGYLPETLRALKRHWNVVDIHDQSEALDWLRGCTELPCAVAIGWVKLHEARHGAWRPGAGQMPASVMLPEVHRIDPELPAIISAAESQSTAIVELIKLGAFDYVVEPLPPASAEAVERYTRDLVLALQRAVQWRVTLLENRSLRQRLAEETVAHPVLTRSPRMRRVLDLAQKVATTSATVLLVGESGTGKELVAHAIHELSGRAQDPFVAINCGSLSETLLTSELFGHAKGAFTGADANKAGLIREAGTGTLFLDEIGTISPGFQALLLRVLEQRLARPVGGGGDYPVRCRFVAAVNRDLESMVANGTFREDLFYRLNVFPLHLPPLRQRVEDIPVLAQHFLLAAAREYGRDIAGFEPAAMQRMERAVWPGNVRQLRNAVERAVILCSESRIGVTEIEESVRLPAEESPAKDVGEDYQVSMRQHERTLLQRALTACGGNATRAAQRLNMKRTTLAYRLHQSGLSSGRTRG
jgi:DNA-binding NtrC family response regulator